MFLLCEHRQTKTNHLILKVLCKAPEYAKKKYRGSTNIIKNEYLINNELNSYTVVLCGFR